MMEKFTIMTSKALSLMLGAGFVALVLSGCEKEGPAERAGEKIDKAVEQADESAEKSGDKAREATN